ncbi:AI-2E family transporter [Sphingosinicellaceae bacterium]|nr:AI-2E family transporter [Sphingosinicellaceae bacterium]
MDQASNPDLGSSSDGLTRSQRLAWLAFVISSGCLGLWIAGSFIRPLVWGAILAVAIEPLYTRAVGRFPRYRRFLPLIFTVTLSLLVVVPLAIGFVQGVAEIHSVTTWIADARVHGVPLPAWADRLPFGKNAIASWWQNALVTPDAAAATLDHINAAALHKSRPFGIGLMHRLVVLIFALLTLFFLLRDREALASSFRLAGERLLGRSGDRVEHQVLASIRGTINGLVLVGIGEGAVLAVAYLVLGVPHPLLLGALTAVAAMIPLGAAVLIGIAALLLLAAGSAGAAIAIVVIGLVVVGVADHVVRPVLIGEATKLPFLWVLIGILGGVETLGILGLFVGPAAMAVLIMLWRDFQTGRFSQRM